MRRAAAADAVDAPAWADRVAVAGLEVAAHDAPAHRITDIASWAGGCVSAGTLLGAAATHTPSAVRTIASATAVRSPAGSTFSAKIASATSAIQNTLITPRANS